MAQLMDYAGYLAKEIGARPAGTEEEQQAALYITEQFQKEAGFTAAMEEFTRASNPVASRAILALVTVLVTILAMIFPVLNIPALILALAAAVIYVLETLDRPIISRFLSRGASQNVVAKYQPAFEDGANGASARGRARKVILVAHYDTDHVKPQIVERIESMSAPVPLICLGAMIAAAFFQLLRVFMAAGGGMGLLVINVLSIICILVCLLPIAKAVLIRQAPYNEGANNNATGAAALIEIARRISRGSVSEADLAQNADEDLHIHGEEAAREAGLVPEGVQIRYEAERLVPPSELGAYDEEERLLAAKAAIAAMTGKPVERRVFGSVADKLVNSYAAAEDASHVESGMSEGAYRYEAEAFAQGSPAVESAPIQQHYGNEQAEGFENAPSWFIAAQKNARKSADEPTEIQRSKYTEAMENAERERAEREEEARAINQAAQEEIMRQREEEARAILEARSVSVEEPLQPEFDAAPAEQPIAAQPVVEQPAIAQRQEEPEPEVAYVPEQDVPASPNSTIAMAAPVPSAEIIAEAAMYDENFAVHADAPAEMPEKAEAPEELEEPKEPENPVRQRIAGLPSIEPAAAEPTPVSASSPSKSGILRKLRSNVPSLSGLIDPVSSPTRSSAGASRSAARRAAAVSVPSVTDTPAQANPVPAQAAGAVQTTASSPVSAEPVDYDMEVPYPGQPAEQQPIAMEVPRSRSANLLNRLRRTDENLQETPQEWLDIDESYEARSVGRDRGSWESFRDEQYLNEEDNFGEFGTGDDAVPARRKWQGGAYSRMQLGHVNMRSGEESDADVMIPQELPEAELDPTLTGEIEQIYHFRNPQFNTEIWFVAIGSDTEGHEGAKAFIEEHRDELRGSMVIEIESLGVGSLSVATEEGYVKKVTASSRIKRYTRAAVAATGLALDDVSLAGSESIASTVQKAGFQAMHLFGAENGRPSLKGSADDVLENVDELTFEDNVSFVYELLKN